MTSTRINPEDDWGCVPDDELFFNAGPTLDFKFLLKQFIENIKNQMVDDDKIFKDEEEELNDEFNNDSIEEVLEDEFLPLRLYLFFKG
jgi:hypothetical protein